MLENFRASFPTHELAADVTTKLAVAYVEAGNSARAASEFERIADGDGPSEVKREALWRSAELYADERARASPAATAYGRFVERYPRPGGGVGRSAPEAASSSLRPTATRPSARAGCVIS